jgi:hypothetical protein
MRQDSGSALNVTQHSALQTITGKYSSWQHRILAAVLRIHAIFVRIRIRGSIPLTNGSGCGYGSCYFLRYIYIIFSEIKVKKKSQNSRNQCFSFSFFSLMIEGSGSGSVSLANGSRFDPGDLKTCGSYGFGFWSGSATMILGNITLSRVFRFLFQAIPFIGQDFSSPLHQTQERRPAFQLCTFPWEYFTVFYAKHSFTESTNSLLGKYRYPVLFC